jgi:hypothetical protein
MPQLIFGNADDHYSNSEPGKILLKLKLTVNRHEHVELVLGDGQQSAIFEPTPALVVNSSRLMIQEKGLDPWIYALVNKDAHSRI